MKILPIALAAAIFANVIWAADMIQREHPARTPKRVWIRRATLIAGCAASLAFDSASTQRAVSGGAIETNGLLAGPHGAPLWGRMFAIKAATCGASAIFQESQSFGAWRNPNADWSWTAINSGSAALYTWSGWHNLRVARQR